MPLFSSAAINDYIYKNSDLPSFSNYGSVGLIQMPTARFFEEGSLALNWSHNDPYINGALLRIHLVGLKHLIITQILIMPFIVIALHLVEIKHIRIKALMQNLDC